MTTPSNKVAIVTGATGIAAAVCERLMRDGFSMVAPLRLVRLG